ncbi:MAG: hypothetical protein HYY52_09000 [Candidatus Melainabacteria bacterium]|nr:hypothetical protein [Candidatus Melainabacteria bacterium]
MSIKNKLGFQALLNTLQVTVGNITDIRQKSKIDYSMWDIVGSTFAMMFFQDPSMLQFQERMKEKTNICNLETMVKVKNVPKEKTIRFNLNEIDSSVFSTSFKTIFSNLDSTGELEKFKFMDKYICAIDASEYFSSKNVFCKHCLKNHHTNDTTTYSHQVLVPLIVHPGKKQVLPLMPEEIKNGDGDRKQDCEINAAKRLVPKIKGDFPDLPLVFTGDALYTKQSFIELLKENNYSFILTAKEGNNKTLFEQIKNTTNIQNKEVITKDKKYEYEWVDNLDLNLSEKTIKVNYFAFKIIDIKSGKVTYKSSWITDLKIDEYNIEASVKAGRSRWKIENECFNILKNNGYEMEHSYGHGIENLSFNFFILTLLSLLFHQIHTLVDEIYQKARVKYGSLQRFWNELKSVIRIVLFKSWDQLLIFMLKPPPLIPVEVLMA